MNRLRYHLLAFALTRTVLNTMYRMVYPFILVFGRGLGVDLPTLSLALTARSVVGAFGPFLASTADSRGRKRVMLLGLFLFSIGGLLMAVWPSYPVFFLTLVLTMLGKVIFDPAMQAYLGDRIPYGQRGLVLALTEFGWSLSFIAGVPLMGVVMARLGWRAPFPLLAGLGLLAAAGLFWLLPGDAKTPGNPPGVWRNLQGVFISVPAITGLGLGFLISAANETINLVFGAWMEVSFGLKIAALGATSLLIGLSELGGEGLTATLVDRLGKPRAVGLGLMANSLAALALPALGRTLPGALAALFLFYITFEFTLVSSIPLMSEVMPSARATLMSVNASGLSLGRALGALLGSRLYLWDIWGCSLAAVALNLLAFLALARLVGEMRKVGVKG